nr:MMPL family transporter [Methylomarinum sp. Ch1-1]MDP4520297.1 MMPL family transporter [Methylomarinum sp. Ch1-1]
MKITQRMAKLAEYFALHPRWVLGLTLVLTIIAGWAAQQLPIHTSRQALLPQNTEVAQRFNDFLQNFGAASDLIVVLEGAPRSELESFANDLAARLRAEPEIGRATSRLDMTFFLNHAYLLLPNEGLDKLSALANNPIAIDGGLEHNLEKALNWSRKNSPSVGTDIELQTAEAGLNLATFFLEQWRRWLFAETVPEDLDWNRLLEKSSVGGMTDGYFASHDGGMLFVFVHPKNASGNFEHLGPFVDKVKRVSANLIDLSQTAGHTPPTVGLTGLPALEYEEYVNIRQDIKFVTITSASLVAMLILLVVRSLRWAALIFIPMGIGVLWSLGLALISVGHLNMITAAFIAILFGLGADYGIFTTSRIAEERRAGKPLLEAIGAGIGSSFTAVLTAGGASLLIFGALSTVDFPGFSELGIIAACGVLMILLSTWLVQPALYALLPPKLRVDSSPKPGLSPAASTKSLTGFPKLLSLTLVILAIGTAVFGGLKGFAADFDYDVLAMLPEDSQAAYYQRRMVEESDIQPEVIIFTAQDMDEARRINREAGKLKTIAQTQSLTGLFPEDADHRLRQAESIGETFSRSDYRKQLAELEHEGLSSTSFELVKAILANSTTIIDQAQEQAFSAGHVSLVESLENIREQLRAIAAQLKSDDPLSRARSESFYAP